MTITTIYPNPALIAAAAKSIARFLTSSNANLKYLGITALAAIVKVRRVSAYACM
jgi:AP-4 complex subunit epsilon-1